MCRSTRDPDTAVSEGVNAVIHAAPRTELKGTLICTPWIVLVLHLTLVIVVGMIELHVLRDLLMHKYGRDYSAAVMENRDGVVSEGVRWSIHSHSAPRHCTAHAQCDDIHCS